MVLQSQAGRIALEWLFSETFFRCTPNSSSSRSLAPLAMVAATYALKSVVDQLAIDVAARQTAADVTSGLHGASVLSDLTSKGC